jgi:Domain of unknown function (DUF5679)
MYQKVQMDFAPLLTAYCVKCRKRDMAVSEPTLVANVKGVPLLEGKCGTCGKSVRRFIKKTVVSELSKSGLVKSTLSDETIAALKEIKPRKAKESRAEIVKVKKEKKQKQSKKKKTEVTATE